MYQDFGDALAMGRRTKDILHMVPRFQVFTDRKGRGVFPDGRNDIWTCCV
jgi:hypothetical protein